MSTLNRPDVPHITVILSTYNRCAVLAKTLDNFSSLDCSGLRWNLVVVNNNCSDTTDQVCSKFLKTLPLTVIFEEKPGKNRALNNALDNAEIGDVVLFTDDDVAPPKDWLVTVVESLRRYPETKAFGGPVHMVWPDSAPGWAKSLEKVIYPQHDYGPDDRTYSQGSYPIGPNFWVRSNLFKERGFRYNERIGPVPDGRKRIMGSETSFLQMLKDNGFEIRYVSGCSVGHYVTEEQIVPDYVRKRAKTHGRYLAHVAPSFDNESLYRKSKFLWKLNKMAACIKNAAAGQLARLDSDLSRRYRKQVEACRWLAFNLAYLNSHREIWTEKISDSNKRKT
ncbi:glycosyltransferase family A protein [Pelagicoccus sp. SDUM812002]|uniref:glycosyltransferase n=1 Tax=Pelagicoccus sp. SDUM812002 TaxID=3041266 RepID=UPI00280C4BD5|nr:glycosyltransferase family A protein [Pelagicoccus sp. SDUM812002]MDQ8188474.1 glycosyltransferase family A protein [Pelagicoccus sp. SDUM812002]